MERHYNVTDDSCISCLISTFFSSVIIIEITINKLYRNRHKENPCMSTPYSQCSNGQDSRDQRNNATVAEQCLTLALSVLVSIS
jgi:hypothetical protein